jgi:hypothetical protein
MDRILAATNERASEVRPEHSGPAISVRAPTGSPPPNRSSTVDTPVGHTGRITCGRSVSAEGILSARLDSISRRIVAAEVMIYIRRMFAFPTEACNQACTISAAV